MTIIKETRDEQEYLHSFNDEPAVIYEDGRMFWYIHGILHRDNGPAIEYSNGNKFWYLDGILYNFHQWIKLSPLPDEQKMELLLSHEYN